MSEWKKEISDFFTDLDNRRIVIHKALYALLEELKREPGIKRIEFDAANDIPLIWKVSINGREFTIKEEEVTEKQKYIGELFDQKLRESELDIPTALKELLISKATGPIF